MRAYPKPKNDADWDTAIRFWEELLSPAAKSFGWQWPWFTRPSDDEANLFSAWQPSVARGFTLDERDDGILRLDAFFSTFDKDGSAITFLRVRTDASVGNISTICRLFDLWAGTDITPDQMEAVLGAINRGDRRALINVPGG
jgi:hypothetical protein